MAGGCRCAQGCTCAMVGTASVGITGNGSLGAPFRGQVAYSTDAGNWAGPGTDGGVMARPQLLGPDGEPLVPDGEGAVQVPPPCILDYAGEPLVPDPETGCVQLPTDGAPPPFGCGLVVVGGELRAKTSGTWPGDDLHGVELLGSEADGSGIYCGLDGTLFGNPEHTSIAANAAATVLPITFVTVDPGDNFITDPGPSVAITNPSPARHMTVTWWGRAIFDLFAAESALPSVTIQRRENGGGWVDSGEVIPATSADAAIRSRVQMITFGWAVIGPSSSYMIEHRAFLAAQGTGAATAITAAVSTMVLGVTR